ncbi:cyclophilin-like protein [Saitoella complicata NRRL Y-17804]|uniref:cyclophilin-like protein n=1 Tax=Saitoella complicata (strain BCRC 22490 / CBS 7301 / JCM 7358 / NBRC 10748 / NRRL Y-17804) TaxID=698492 RepID=UPI000866EF6E|nr:cyclophilin-like protein [Saitoella complicata NRRL Y-17804]ODQ52449.1 cyclophilin-like protein [Saitoella complicata NRRL Y-17804]
MSVLLETTEGDIVIDLHVDYVPKVCENFLKLCKVKYYNFSPLFNINPTAFFQSGDPIGPPDGDGGTSIYGLLQGPSRRYFKADRNPKLKHVERGTVSMTISKDKTTEHELAGSQFIVTLADNLDYLDASAVPFGRVAEGFDTLEKIVGLYLDHDGRPYKDTRILHTIILDDPFPDPEGLTEPTASPPPSKAQLATVRISEDELNNTTDEALTESELSARKREREAKAQALTLEMLGDLPSADLAPPENVLFVCKLNPLTSSPDLSLIFSRFGQIISCRIITDPHTGASLGYGFIEFEKREECERAYFKMQGVLIDDRRIHVDFGQSLNGGRGVDWGAWYGREGNPGMGDIGGDAKRGSDDRRGHDNRRYEDERRGSTAHSSSRREERDDREKRRESASRDRRDSRRGRERSPDRRDRDRESRRERSRSRDRRSRDDKRDRDRSRDHRDDDKDRRRERSRERRRESSRDRPRDRSRDRRR